MSGAGKPWVFHSKVVSLKKTQLTQAMSIFYTEASISSQVPPTIHQSHIQHHQMQCYLHFKVLRGQEIGC